MTTKESGAPRWRSWLTATAWSMSGIGLIAFSGCLAYATFGEASRLTRVPPTPPEVTHDVIVRDVGDLQGRRASFRILLFTDKFRWRINSYRSLENQPAQPHFTPEMKAVLNSAEEIICVGASSEEVAVAASTTAGRTAEERRAARRADQIAVWVREALQRPIPLRKLNVGLHGPTGQVGNTSDQRRVVIILVLDHDADANIDEALRAAMLGEKQRAPIFETLLTRYSLGTGPAFTWVP